MALEIERKFIVDKNLWAQAHQGTGTAYRQGYLYAGPDKAIRVRVAGEAAFLTIKGASQGASRSEYEYAVPVADAIEMLDKLCGSVIRKVRYKVVYEGNTWEVDVFEGANEGLVLAELELPDEAYQFALPAWVSTEVTGDERYFNAYLAKHPFQGWAPGS